ncbi:hypothetical protein BDQ12DRAFT_686679 [Crucibulum laeve]|uniref:Uncharacterized protein n=1 Tax=Crucibulum laeve TaxID=68775 RepID=A0A5C3LUF5_9AGAR|nr:hypothetical protein BDQ12DRAFT_686679 [Crucibulum laeve]
MGEMKSRVFFVVRNQGRIYILLSSFSIDSRSAIVHVLMRSRWLFIQTQYHRFRLDLAGGWPLSQLRCRKLAVLCLLYSSLIDAHLPGLAEERTGCSSSHCGSYLLLYQDLLCHTPSTSPFHALVGRRSCVADRSNLRSGTKECCVFR